MKSAVRSRRGRGEGAIYRRADGLWCATLPLISADGKRRRLALYGKSKQDVREKLLAKQLENAVGKLVGPSRLRIADHLSTWLEFCERPAIRQSTYSLYKTIISRHILPHLGSIMVEKITPLEVQTFFSRLESDGVSAHVRLKVHNILHKSINQAIKLSVVYRNPLDAIQRPRIPQKAIEVLDQAQIRDFLSAAKYDRLYALYFIALMSGLRQGELFGLFWRDVDFKSGALTIQHTLQEIDGKLLREEPKTKSGRRRIILPPSAVNVLREHQKQCATQKGFGPWVFTDTEGRPLRKSNFIRRSYKPLLARAGLAPIPFRNLRHSAATLLLTLGEHAKVVQERLGHSKFSVTMDLYSAVVPSVQQGAATKLEAFLNGDERKIGYN